MAGAKQIAVVPSLFLAVITDNQDNAVVETQPTKEELYGVLTETVETGDIDGLEYHDVEELSITVYEVINKPWKVELGHSKVTITEKTE